MKSNLFIELVESIEEAGKIKSGKAEPSRIFQYSPVDIKRIRNRLDVSPAQFALMIGVSNATLQNWEQGRRIPGGPVKALLRVVDKQPEAVLKALQVLTRHFGRAVSREGLGLLKERNHRTVQI